MGSGVSVEDPSKLRREYEALAAKNVGDQELLDHMKKLIISPPAGALIVGVVSAVVRKVETNFCVGSLPIVLQAERRHLRVHITAM